MDLPDPFEQTEPGMELVDPTPRSALAALRDQCDGRLGRSETEDLVLATSEAVTNALHHGSPPVTVRIGTGDSRVVVHVRDSGSGPADPLAGLLPADGSDSAGLGLWLAGQLEIDVALLIDDDDFTVRLRAGSPPA